MRNILEYPITDDEMKKALEEAIERALQDEPGFGSIAPAALCEIRNRMWPGG